MYVFSSHSFDFTKPDTKSAHKHGCHDEFEHNKSTRPQPDIKWQRWFLCAYENLTTKKKVRHNGGFSFYSNDYPESHVISKAHHTTFNTPPKMKKKKTNAPMNVENKCSE